jgi:cobalamin biosynthesis protein CbiD
MAAAAADPTEAPQLTDHVWVHARSNLNHTTHHLMARNQGVVAQAPLVIEHGEIAVAEAAVQNLQHKLISCGLKPWALGLLQTATGL